ncbi:MAG: hypothetical protein WBA74_17195 [Cyclobacteriaceae bacterium]
MMSIFNPKIKISSFRVNNFNVNVVRDDYLVGGTKQRAMFEYLNLFIEDEYVYATPSKGYAQIALAYTCMIMKKKATIFVSKQSDGMISYLSLLAQNYGAKLIITTHVVPIKNLQKKAYDYCMRNKSRKYISFGCNTDSFKYFLQKNIISALPKTFIYPKRIWCVAGSGTLLDVFSKIWPMSEFHVVQVGKTIWPDQRGINDDGTFNYYSELYIAPERFNENAEILPPYKSVLNYDAKIWRFVLLYGKEGDLIWNVAG